jgi:4-hydroxy-3-methylbut-2-enyl diphosphate reductase IspH
MDLGLVYMDGKLRHRPKTFMRVQDSKRSFSSSNCSNKKEVRIFLAAQTLFSIQPISRVLKVQIGKLRQMAKTFMKTICSNYDVSNDVLFRQEDNSCHQVKR